MRRLVLFAALVAVLLFLALFASRFLTLEPDQRSSGFIDQMNAQSGSVFETGRKNYASGKKLGSAGSTTPIADSQKFEKIGSVTQSTTAFDEDRKAADRLIESEQGIVQVERATGLRGYRLVHLGIGVPPDRFDGFIEKARAIGKAQAIEIVKNDKTNEYLQMKAKRATLEKARAALEELKAGGGSLDERVNVQTRLTDIEQQIQDLGVSLGDFDTENELCTVRLTLQEVVPAQPLSMARRAVNAFEWALYAYAALGIGFAGLVIAAAIAFLVAREAGRILARQAW